MQLLRITTTPIRYRLEIERARLELKKNADVQMRMDRRPAQINIQSKNIQVRLDTTDMRSSIGLQNVGEKIARAAQDGMQAADEAKGNYAEEGRQLGNITSGATIGQMAAQKAMQQPESMMVFLPSTGPVISWDPAQLNLDYQPGHLSFDWQMMRNLLDYVPGKFQMIIEQMPKVDIEYLGKPNYVPPSASPDYVE